MVNQKYSLSSSIIGSYENALSLSGDRTVIVRLSRKKGPCSGRGKWSTCHRKRLIIAAEVVLITIKSASLG